jgi:hypothetical protein
MRSLNPAEEDYYLTSILLGFFYNGLHDPIIRCS